MAKSLTIINKEIADSLRLQNLTKPPEAYELTKLSHDLDQILKRPHNFLQSGPLLNEYYNKLIKFMMLLKNMNQGSYNQTISKPEPEETITENRVTNDLVDVDPLDIQNQQIDLINLDSTFNQNYPQQQSTPLHANTPYSTPSSSKQFTPASAGDSLKNPIKLKLLEKIADRDKNFVLNNETKTMLINGNMYSNRDFNQLYIKLRNPEKNKKVVLDHGQQELLAVIKGTLEQSLDTETSKFLKKLPGLQRLIAGQPSKAQTRRSKQITKQSLPTTSSNTPKASKKSPKGKVLNLRGKGIKLLSRSTKQNAKKKLPKPKQQEGKIHFKRWTKFLRFATFSFFSKSKKKSTHIHLLIQSKYCLFSSSHK